jgi:hypothetical protein
VGSLGPFKDGARIQLEPEWKINNELFETVIFPPNGAWRVKINGNTINYCFSQWESDKDI